MKQLGYTLQFCLLFLLVGCPDSAPPSSPSFNLHLFMEPNHLDPIRLRGSSAGYLFYNTLRGLYRFDDSKGLIEDGGHCQWLSPLKLSCQVFESSWSNGKKVTAADYKRGFLRLVNPENGAPRANLLENIKNARGILSGQKDASEIAMTVISPNTFEILFEKRDPEFIYKLSSTALFPTPENQVFNKDKYENFITNGAYKISHWVKGKHLTLSPAPTFSKGHPERPDVTFYFVDDEMTAFRLYERGKLQFLRRTPSSLMTQLKGRPDFFQKQMARFDYVGFGPRLLKNKKLREALAYSIDYQALKKLLGALGPPGCPSLPHKWMAEAPCFRMDLIKAKKSLAQVPDALKKLPYQLKVSALGGEDIKKQAEFYQSQWKQYLGLNIEIQQVEQKTFLNELRSNPPDIFRKGVGLDRPTCLDGLETFTSDNRNNFMGWTSGEYQKILDQMNHGVSRSKYKKLCSKALSYLKDQVVAIPLGEMHFSLMAKPGWQGWSINSMNQLDLTNLHFKK